MYFTDLHLAAAGAWVVLDTNTPPLNKLTVIGVLEVEDTASRSRQARSTHGTVVIDAVYVSIQVSFTDDHFDLHDDDTSHCLTRWASQMCCLLSFHSEMMCSREGG